jgi:hypothetical protein
MIPRYQSLRSRTPMKRVNKERKASNFVRAYHSVAFVKFVERLHCLVDGCESTESECAHLVKDDQSGGSRKSGYQCCGPLCTGHHDELDNQLGREKFEEKYGVCLQDEADKVQILFARVEPFLDVEFACDVDFNEEEEDFSGSPEPETEI